MQKKYVLFFFLVLICISIILDGVCSAEDEKKELTIIAPAQVTEGAEFTVTVKCNDILIKNATVNFNISEGCRSYPFAKTKNTNSTGQAVFYGCFINNNTTQTITAYKEGYISTSINITVIKAPPRLTIICFSTCPAGDFTLAVISNGSRVSGAIVTFAGVNKTTDEYGNVTFSTSMIDKAGYYTVVAKKPGFIDGENYIHMYPLHNDENLALLVAILFFPVILPTIIIIIIILIILFLKRRKIV
jgi:hypothetical protein